MCYSLLLLHGCMGKGVGVDKLVIFTGWCVLLLGFFFFPVVLYRWRILMPTPVQDCWFGVVYKSPHLKRPLVSVWCCASSLMDGVEGTESSVWVRELPSPRYSSPWNKRGAYMAEMLAGRSTLWYWIAEVFWLSFVNKIERKVNLSEDGWRDRGERREKTVKFL